MNNLIVAFAASCSVVLVEWPLWLRVLLVTGALCAAWTQGYIAGRGKP